MDPIELYFSIPKGRDPQTTLRHADRTANVFSFTFTCPFNEYVAEDDGTYRATGPASTASMVKRVMTEQEGLEFVREAAI